MRTDTSGELERFGFHPVIRAWFEAQFGVPTGVQLKAWEHIRGGSHTLISSPTGSGKTLAALLPCLDDVVRSKAAAGAGGRTPGVRVLYVTPLKALNNDIRHHVVQFADEMGQEAERQRFETAWPGLTVGVRTGDTPQSTRASMLRKPPDVLVTTPESLYLLLTSPRARDILRSVQSVIVDEIHDVAGDKRGMHLSLTLERLVAWCGREPQRIGVSATQKPIERVARYLGGWDDGGRLREVRIVEHLGEKRYELRVGLPEPLGRTAKSTDDAVWTPLVRRIFALMEAAGARTTLIFVNNRTLSERLTLRLNEQAGFVFARAHHGSVAREQRLEVETLLKEGRLRCLVATSSLELGIDVGHVDLVIQIDAPGSAAAALQRIGRAGHAAGAVSRAALLARSRSGLAGLAALARRVAARDIESIRVPREGLDVLAQHIVAMLAAGDDWDVARLERLLSRSDSYRGFPREKLLATLDMLAGHYPFVRPLIAWDRASGRLERLPATGMAAILGAGTIPQSTAYPVHHHESGIHLGELDEEYIFESQVDDTFQLGTTSWRIQRIQADRVYVTETANRFSEIPFWRGEGAHRSLELSRDVGRLWRELEELLVGEPAVQADTAPEAPAHSSSAAAEAETAALSGENPPSSGDDALRSAADRRAALWLGEACFMEPEAAEQLVRLARAQRAHTRLPTDRTVVLEQFADEQNRVHFVLHSVFGRIVNRTWLLAIERKLAQLGITPAHKNAKDNGIELVFVYGERIAAARGAITAMTADEGRRLVAEAAAGSPYFAAAFRELTETSLLLSRSFTRVPAFVKRLRTEELLKNALPFKDRFPLFAEAVRVCLERKLDVPGMTELLAGLETGGIAWSVHEAVSPSPMTAQYEFDYVAANMYESDAVPRDVQLELLGISRKLAEEAFGPAAGPPLDPNVVAEERARAEELPGGLQQHADLVRLLKERGDYSREELLPLLGTDRTDDWLRSVIAEGSAAEIALGSSGETRYICSDELPIYEALPDDANAVMFILKRYADTRFSFTTEELMSRYPLTRRQAEDWIAEAERFGLIQPAPFALGEEEGLWMSAKTASRLIRYSLRTFRASREGLNVERYAFKLLELHGVSRFGAGAAAAADDPALALKEALRPLQGWFAPVSQWESLLLPARLPGYRKEHLDLLCASGDLLWIGRKAEGEKVGNVAFFLTEDKELYAPFLNHPPTEPSSHPELLRLLQTRGASFLTKLSLDIGLAPSALLAQLLQLVWEGRVSNDQFAPLRTAALGPAKRTDKFRSGLGRWYALASDQDDNVQTDRFPAEAASGEPSHEASALSWARHLLDSYGIVSKPLAAALCPFSWDTMTGVLKQLELLGHVARGLFIRELESIQFASPSFLSELAEAASTSTSAGEDAASPPLLLAATDPSSAYGWLLPWPAAGGRNAGYARKHGNWLVWQHGRWTLWLENGGRRIVTPNLSGSRAAVTPDTDLKAILQQCLKRQGLRKIVIDAWDGRPIGDTPQAAVLQSFGAERDRSSLVLWPSQLG